MIRINLLPFRAARKKENIRRQLSIFLLCIVLVLTVGFTYNYHLGGKIKGLKSTISETKTELEKFKKINKQIANIKKKLKVLEQKTKVIERLEKNRFAPVQMLDTMSAEVLEKRMWFTRFQDIGNNVKINGIALDNKTIADFMTRLENTGKFSRVKLNKINKKTMKGSNLKQFAITCRKKQPKKPPATNKKSKKKKK